MKPFRITQSITDKQDASLGMYFKDVSKEPMISAEEEAALAKKVKEGDQSAIDKLVKSNLRFVISVAKQYQNKGLPLVDLIQEGNLGLIRSAYSYDEDKGFRFISYAVWWIRQSIIKAISDQCRTVRLPMTQINYLNKINKVIEKFEQEHGRKPATEEIGHVAEIPIEKVSMAMVASNRSISLESPFKDDDAGCLLDIIPDNSIEELDEGLIRNDLRIKIEEILKELSYRDQDVIRMTYGIGMPPLQNEEIASRFGIGCERVRQIQHEAIAKIRINHKKDLKDLHELI